MMLPPLTFLLLLFPDGRVTERRWRWVARIAGAGIALVFVGRAADAGAAGGLPADPQPLGAPAADVLAAGHPPSSGSP